MRRSTLILILAVVLLNVAAQAYSIPTTGYIRERSASVNTDLALRFAYFAFMLITAFVEALLFDELRYGGAWRKRFFGGRRAPGPGDTAAGSDEALELSDAEFEDAIQSKRSSVRSLIAENSLPFFLAFFLLLGSNFLLFNALNGWFDLYYGRGGHLVTQLRSKKAAERSRAILGLSFKRSDKVGVDLEKLLGDRLENGSAKEKVWAAWALGYRRKLKLPLKPAAQVDRAEDLLVRLLETGTTEQQRAAVISAARYVLRRGDDASARLVPAARRFLERQVAQGSVSVEAVLAMGYLREKTAVPALGGLLTSADETLAVAAAWALARMQHPQALGPLLRGLKGARPQVRCAIVRAFGSLGHAARVSKPMMDEFQRKTSDFDCKRLTVVLRPDGRGKQIHDKVHLAGMTERYRVQILRTMAKVKFLEDAVPWLKQVSLNHAYHKRVRAYAKEYHSRLQRQIIREP
ncbi:MAG: HEAT repeat domain-containing protein [bacterium]